MTLLPIAQQQKKARKLFAVSSLVLAVACAMALANTEEPSGSTAGQQAGEVPSEEQSGHVEMNQDPTLEQTEGPEVSTGGAAGTYDTATSRKVRPMPPGQGGIGGKISGQE